MSSATFVETKKLHISPPATAFFTRPAWALPLTNHLNVRRSAVVMSEIYAILQHMSFLQVNFQRKEAGYGGPQALHERDLRISRHES